MTHAPRPFYDDLINHVQVAKLGLIQLKQIQQLNASEGFFLIRKHKELLNLMMRMFQLDTYSLTWIQFFKGVGIGAVAVWFLMR